MLAIIGGSAVEQLRGFATAQTVRHATPWGEPSAPVHAGAFCGVPALYLARHGEPHAIAPHRINYRANLRALADLGVRERGAILRSEPTNGEHAHRSRTQRSSADAR